MNGKNMSSYGTRVNSRRNRTKSKKDNLKRDDYLRTQKGNGRQDWTFNTHDIAYDHGVAE